MAGRSGGSRWCLASSLAVTGQNLVEQRRTPAIGTHASGIIQRADIRQYGYFSLANKFFGQPPPESESGRLGRRRLGIATPQDRSCTLGA